MKDEEIQIGDKLRIREWDSMVVEFGMRDGEILCEGRFVGDMRELCGRPFTVAGKTSRFLPGARERWEYTSFENSEIDDGIVWIITSDMLERVTDSEPNIGSTEDFDAKFSALFA